MNKVPNSTIVCPSNTPAPTFGLSIRSFEIYPAESAFGFGGGRKEAVSERGAGFIVCRSDFTSETNHRTIPNKVRLECAIPFFRESVSEFIRVISS